MSCLDRCAFKTLTLKFLSRQAAMLWFSTGIVTSSCRAHLVHHPLPAEIQGRKSTLRTGEPRPSPSGRTPILPSHYFPFLTEPLPKDDFQLLPIILRGSVGPRPAFPALPIRVSTSSRSFPCLLQAKLTLQSLKSLPLCTDWRHLTT